MSRLFDRTFNVVTYDSMDRHDKESLDDVEVREDIINHILLAGL